MHICGFFTFKVLTILKNCFLLPTKILDYTTEPKFDGPVQLASPGARGI